MKTHCRFCWEFAKYKVDSAKGILQLCETHIEEFLKDNDGDIVEYLFIGDKHACAS